MKIKRILSAALCAALLAVPALASGTGEGDVPAEEPGMCAGLPLAPREGGESGDAYQPLTQDPGLPVMVYGAVTELGEDRLRLQNDRDSSVNDIVLNVGEDTLILDAVTGEDKTLADIRENDMLYAYAGPVMTRSLPPISNAALILCNLPADFGAPIYAEVQRVTPGEDGGLSVLMTGDIVLHLSADTQLLAHGGKGGAELSDIVPGTRLLSWYTMVMESFPAQAVPSKVMVFPYGYRGYVEVKSPEEVLLNGEKLSAAPVTAEDGTLMLPVRAFAEALGCEVLWDAANPQRVAVTKDGMEVYSFGAGENTATVEGDMVMELAAPVLARGGVTYLAAQDLIRFHGLKLVGDWPV